jgi:hypothetical protein
MPSDPFGDEDEEAFSATDVARLLRAANAPDPDDGEEEIRGLSAAINPQTAASLAPDAPRSSRRKKKPSMPSNGEWEVQIKQGKRWGWLASFYGASPEKDAIRKRFGSGEFRILEQQSGWSANFTIAHAPNGTSPGWGGSQVESRPVEEVVAETVGMVVPNAVNEAVAGLMEQFQPLIAGFLQKDAEVEDDPRLAMMERELEMTRTALAQVSQQQPNGSPAANPIMDAVMDRVVSAGLENLGLGEKEDDSFVSQALKAATALFEARAVAGAMPPQAQIAPPPPGVPQRPSLPGMTPDIEGELRTHAGRLGLDFNDAMVEAQKSGVNASALLNIARSQ